MELAVGSVMDGKVTGITKFGAFVALPGGRSGLVHISEIANAYVNDVREHLTEGQEVKVRVLSIDDHGRINLSIKKALPPPPRPERGPAAQAQPFRPAARSGGRPPVQRWDRTQADQNKGPNDFEDRLKQFMQSSDSKLSDLRMNEKRNNRRSGHR